MPLYAEIISGQSGTMAYNDPCNASLGQSVVTLVLSKNTPTIPIAASPTAQAEHEDSQGALEYPVSPSKAFSAMWLPE